MLKVKDKEKILKQQEKYVTYKQDPIGLTANFAAETMGPEGSGITYMKCSRGKLINQECPVKVTIIQK